MCVGNAGAKSCNRTRNTVAISLDTLCACYLVITAWFDVRSVTVRRTRRQFEWVRVSVRFN